MNLMLLTGRDALAHVDSVAFQSRWKTLYDGCPWATACQHPDFVSAWYEVCHKTILPIIVFEESADGALAALLTLALHQDGTTMTGAGGHHAEYQGWIQAPDYGGNFIIDAIKEVRAVFPGVNLCLKYLPPGTPLHWIEQNADYDAVRSLRCHRRPVMKIDAAAMARQRSKKNYRQNFNRLKRLGDVQFESVVAHHDFIRVFDEICVQYDFRQAALYRNMPFASDPTKKRLYLELQKRGLLHTTLLTVGKEVAASHIGLLSKDGTVHLGINTYDPALASHSPGHLLLAMLGVHLATEQMSVLDLTPGGDEYKERFATEHDAVFELTIYSDSKSRLRTETLLSMKRVAKNRLRIAGYRTADVLAALEKLRRFRSFAWRDLLGHLHSRFDSRSCAFRYCQEPPAVIKSRLAISKDRLRDVLKYDAQGSSARYCEFLGGVMKRFERSNHLYSFVQDEKLQIFCWVRIGTVEPARRRPAPVAAVAVEAVVLFDLYVHPHLADHGLVQRFMEQILSELRKHQLDAEFYYRGALDVALQPVLRSCGFIDEPRRRARADDA